MRIVCISDTHMTHRSLTLPEGDVLIHAGDATGRGTVEEVSSFLRWFNAQPHARKILIAGNHDWLFQRHPGIADQLLAENPDVTYLQDSGVEIDGVKFWGSPWQPWFMDWAFNLPRKGAQLGRTWERIPMDTDVLITHGPPYGALDLVEGREEHLGCEELQIRLAAVRPRLHVFGHIHSGFGIARLGDTTYVNACTCTEAYKALHPPVVVDLTPEGVVVHATEPNTRLAHLEGVHELLEAPLEGPTNKTVAWLPEAWQDALVEVAEARGMAPSALLAEYARRGLLADVAKEIRQEQKLARKVVPIRKVEP